LSRRPRPRAREETHSANLLHEAGRKREEELLAEFASEEMAERSHSG